MSLLSRALVLLAATATLAVPALPAAAAGAPPVQGEHMPTVTGRTAVVLDGLASGRRARALPSGTRVAVRLHTPSRTDRLVLRLRRGRSGTSPRVVVSLDGRRAGALSVTSRTWRTYTLRGAWSAGTYTLRLRAADTAGREAPVLVDRAVFGPGARASRSRTLRTAPSDDAYERRIVQLVNAERVRAGLRPLATSSCADRYAESWSRRMAASRDLEHRGDLGALLGACGATRVGENIAYGSGSADATMRMWMRSSGHRANILKPAYTHIGVGTQRTGSGRVYATQNFLRTR